MHASPTLTLRTLCLSALLALAPIAAHAETPPADKIIDSKFFMTFNEICIGPGPRDEDIVAALEARGAVRLPDMKDADPADPATIHGYMLATPDPLTVMLNRNGRCTASGESVDIESARAMFEVFISVWKQKATVTELPEDLRPAGFVAGYRVDLPGDLTLIMVLARSDGWTLMSRQMLKR